MPDPEIPALESRAPSEGEPPIPIDTPPNSPIGSGYEQSPSADSRYVKEQEKRRREEEERQRRARDADLRLKVETTQQMR